MVKVQSISLTFSLFVLLSAATAQQAAPNAVQIAEQDPRGHFGQPAKGDTSDPITPGIEFLANDPVFNPTTFCAGKTLTNDSQITTGSCSSTPIGTVLDTAHFPASKFLAPTNGQTIPGDKDFTLQLKINNFKTGFFDSATFDYYAVPFTTDPQTGFMQGHSHVTVQALGAATAPPDPNVKQFFKGLNDDGGAAGILSVTIPANTLTAGINRACSMIGGRGHAPPPMSLIQRGNIDDCVRFNVVGSNPAATGAATAPAAAGNNAAAAQAAAAKAATAAAAAQAGAAAGNTGAQKAKRALFKL